MYKILLADEEGIAIKALRNMIDANYSKNCDIRLALNARRLMDVFSKFQPDIVFLNIHMTGVHGIPTLRELHAMNRDCQFIIVSYNKNFSFEREGRNLGVYGYLTKPFHAEVIRDLLKKCFAYITTQQKRTELENFNKQQLEEAVPLLENAMISELLLPDPQGSQVSLYRQFLGIKYNYAWVCDLKYGQITEHGTMCNPIGSMMLLSKSVSYFRVIVKAFFPSAIIGPILSNHVVFLVPCREENLSEEEVKFQEKRVRDMTYQLHRKMDLRFRYTISDPQSIE